MLFGRTCGNGFGKNVGDRFADAVVRFRGARVFRTTLRLGSKRVGLCRLHEQRGMGLAFVLEEELVGACSVELEQKVVLLAAEGVLQ